MKNEKIHKLLEHAGNNHNYQYYLFLIVFFIYGVSEFFTKRLPDFTPLENLNQDAITQQMRLDFCSQYNNQNNSNNQTALVIPDSFVNLDLNSICGKAGTDFSSISIFFGVLIGSIFHLILSDSLGRRKTVIISGLFYLTTLIFLNLFNNLYINIIVFTINGFSYIIVTLSSFILIHEVVKSHLVSVFSSFFTSASHLFSVVFPVILYLFSNSISLYFFVGLVFFISIIIFILYSVESPLYLYSEGRLEELKESLESIKKKNYLTTFEHDIEEKLSENFLDKKDSNVNQSQVNLYTVFHLISLKSQRLNFISVSLIWFSCAFIYQGISMNIKKFNNTITLIEFQTSIIEFLVITSTGFLTNFMLLGRKKTIIGFLILSLLSILIIVFLDSNSVGFFYIALIAKLSLGSVFSIIHFVASEIYPTPLRAKGLSINAIIAGFGSKLAPIAIGIFNFDSLIFIYIGFILASLILGFVIEETLNNSMKSFVPEE